MSRETWYRPLGLITQPNEMGQYPAGAMSQAQNLVARNPGELEQRLASGTFSVGTLPSGNWPVKLLYTGFQAVSIAAFPAAPASTRVTWTVGGTNTIATVPDASHMTLTFNGWPDAQIFRNRVIICSEGDPIICDSLNPTTTAERTFRYMSLPQLPIQATNSSIGGQAVTVQRSCGYAALVKRVYADGYEVIGPPSLVIRFINSSSGAGLDRNVEIYCPFGFGRVRAGDVIEVYRTQSVPFNGVNNPNPDPGSTCYLVASQTVTAADITNQYTLVVDNAKDGPIGEGFGGLGRAMYTNSGQSGLEGTNTPPPAAKRLAIYKGRAFYANYQLPGDSTVAFRGGSGTMGYPPGFGGSTPLSARAAGVGDRYVMCQFTNGSPTLTAVTADSFIGLVTGQYCNYVNLGGYITALNPGASTITISNPATGNSGGQVAVRASDVIELTYGYSPTGQTSVIGGLLQSLAPYESSARTVSPFNSFAHYDQAAYFTGLLAPSTNLTIRGTNGQNYDPAVPIITQVNNTAFVTAGAAAAVFTPKTFPNGLRWSKDQQPEAVPPSNEIFIGQGEIYGMYSTRDALWIFASDGLWRLSGSMARVGQTVDVRVDPVDSTLIVAGPQAACVLRDCVYAYTNRGLVRVDDLGIQELSEGMVGDLIPGAAWSNGPYVVVTADEDNDDIYITVRPSAAPLANDELTYVYSTAYNIFTSCERVNGFLRPTAYAYDRVSRTHFSITGDNSGTAGSIFKTTRTGGVTYLASIVQFQPSYGDDPMVAKQWIDAMCIFNVEAPGTNSGNFPYWNGTSYGGSNALPIADIPNKESRQNYDCPRASAVGNGIYFGMNMSQSNPTPIVLKAVSLRFEYLSEQQVLR